MKRILFAPSLTVALGVAGRASRAGTGAFSFEGEEGPKFSATADRTSVSLGDRVVVTYAARIPAGATLALDALVTPAPEEGARPPGGAVLEFENPAAPTLTKSKTGDFFEWSQSVALFPFAAGAITVPGPHYTFEESSVRPSRSTYVPPPWS